MPVVPKTELVHIHNPPGSQKPCEPFKVGPLDTRAYQLGEQFAEGVLLVTCPNEDRASVAQRRTQRRQKAPIGIACFSVQPSNVLQFTAWCVQTVIAELEQESARRRCCLDARAIASARSHIQEMHRVHDLLHLFGKFRPDDFLTASRSLHLQQLPLCEFSFDLVLRNVKEADPSFLRQSICHRLPILILDKVHVGQIEHVGADIRQRATAHIESASLSGDSKLAFFTPIAEFGYSGIGKVLVQCLHPSHNCFRDTDRFARHIDYPQQPERLWRCHWVPQFPFHTRLLKAPMQSFNGCGGALHWNHRQAADPALRIQLPDDRSAQRNQFKMFSPFAAQVARLAVKFETLFVSPWIQRLCQHRIEPDASRANPLQNPLGRMHFSP